MRKTELIKGAVCMLSLVMASCSGDVPDKPGGPLESDEVRYLRISISNPHEGTRADGDKYAYGISEENTVNSLYLDFYDASGKFVVRADPKDIEWQDGDWQDQGPNNENVGRYRNGIVTIGLKAAQNVPAYVMCYINPVSWNEQTTYATMDELREITVDSYGNKDKGFAMNNSVYFGNDPLKNSDDVKITGTPIPLDFLYSSEADADSKGVLNIYVERYAAKVQFTANVTSQDGEYTEGGEGIYAYTGGDENNDTDYSLIFNAERWTVNADAPKMYGVKNFTTQEGQKIPTKKEVDDYLTPWKKWNDAVNHRSYWSSSPAFFATDFPVVADNIVDKKTAGATEAEEAEEDTKNTGAGEAVDPYKLKYYSYNQIISISDENATLFTVVANKKPCRYVLENTVGEPAFKSLNPNAAVPSILIVGGYKVTYNGVPVDGNTTFYKFGKDIYFDANQSNLPLIKDKLISVQQILYIKNEDNEYEVLTKDNREDLLSKLEVNHPDEEVRGVQNVPSRFVTLQIKEVPTSDDGTPQLYTKVTDNTYAPVVTGEQGNLNDVNRLLWNQVGVADCYMEGKCYFSIPIQHLGMAETDWGNNGNPSKPIDKNGVIDWGNVKVGDFGLVRNHVYDISVKAIKGLATGIGNLNYPIVPPADVSKYWIKYKINILNWRVVPSQGNIVL